MSLFLRPCMTVEYLPHLIKTNALRTITWSLFLLLLMSLRKTKVVSSRRYAATSPGSAKAALPCRGFVTSHHLQRDKQKRERERERL